MSFTKFRALKPELVGLPPPVIDWVVVTLLGENTREAPPLATVTVLKALLPHVEGVSDKAMKVV